MMASCHWLIRASQYGFSKYTQQGNTHDQICKSLFAARLAAKVCLSKSDLAPFSQLVVEVEAGYHDDIKNSCSNPGSFGLFT